MGKKCTINASDYSAEHQIFNIQKSTVVLLKMDKGNNS